MCRCQTRTYDTWSQSRVNDHGKHESCFKFTTIRYAIVWNINVKKAFVLFDKANYSGLTKRKRLGCKRYGLSATLVALRSLSSRMPPSTCNTRRLMNLSRRLDQSETLEFHHFVAWTLSRHPFQKENWNCNSWKEQISKRNRWKQ